VDAVQVYKSKVTLILLDAKPPKDAAYPGGHGAAFDWTLLKPLSADDTPYMLSGGLHPGNVAAAIATVRGLGVHLAGIDVSSGVESAPGVKDIALIRNFIAAARAADAASAA
jgi:phosphoribosylanthranilate isomerase